MEPNKITKPQCDTSRGQANCTVSQLFKDKAKGPVWREVNASAQEDGGPGSYMS